jgi:hypothetical protein
MNHAELIGSSQMLWQHMAFFKEVLDKPRRFFQDVIVAIDRANLATAEAKAIDQLQERLIGSHIKAEITLEDVSSSPHDGRHEVHICVETPEPLSPEVRFHITQMLIAIYLRYAITIRAEFLNRQKK